MKRLVSASFLFPRKAGMHRKGNVSLAAPRWSLPERNADAELKGGSETTFSITVINIFSFMRAFSSYLEHGRLIERRIWLSANYLTIIRQLSHYAELALRGLQ